MMTLAMLTGQSDEHLVDIDKHRLHPQAKAAFLAMQQAAQQAGFNLQPASSFRDFERQLLIWNEKYNGLRPVLDRNSQPINVAELSPEQRCKTILRWSALPGASRHHWGSDLDIYDPTKLPSGQRLLLEPWEYEKGGYFYELSEWLTQNMSRYHFYRPFQNADSGIAAEPWHISYRPLAEQLQSQLTPELLLQAWQDKNVAGYDWLVNHLNEIFTDYIKLQTA